MNPTTHYVRVLDTDNSTLALPRDLDKDAYFITDRSATAVTRTVKTCELEPGKKFRLTEDPMFPGREHPPPCRNGADVAIPGFLHNFNQIDSVAVNPLQHARALHPRKKKTDPIALDRTITGWKHNVEYTSIASRSALVISEPGNTKRLRVSLLFGTGTEATRHGIGFYAVNASEPALLIFITGIEEGYEITFFNPANPGIMTAAPESKELVANNRWGAGITEDTIRYIVALHFGRVVDYDIVICGAFSTGYLGLCGVINNRLFSIQSLERVIIYDCLYTELRQPLSFLKSSRPSIEIICYVASIAGNDFIRTTDTEPPAFQKLALGNMTGWHYINVFYNNGYHTLASSRVIDQARTPENPIITQLPAEFERLLNDLVSRLPQRGKVVSDPNIYRKVKKSLPSGVVTLNDFWIANGNRVGLWFSSMTIVRQCLCNLELLGWPTPPGDEWHDMILIEFAWEYLL